MDDKLGKVLIVDDDIHINELIDMYLKSGGYSTKKCFNGNDACNIVESEDIGLVILDVMLPGRDGIEVLKHIRKSSDIPVIMLTAKGEVFDKVLALELGADDYMVKPIDFEELILRIGAILRRSKIVNDHKITVGNTVLDYNSLSVTCNGECNTLPKKEFYLLFKLVSSPDTIFTRRQLLDEIWGMESMADERTVDVHIKRIRERYRNSKDFEIITVRGLGYKAVINS